MFSNKKYYIKTRKLWKYISPKPFAVSVKFTPPTMARGHRPFWIASTANCIATREEEQAVSTEMAGPLKNI
jgi:hypothetical protein